MPSRDRLPNRRRCETVEFGHEGLRYVATYGYYRDGRLGEVFLGGAKTTSHANTLASAAAVVASLALQHGVSLVTLRAALPRLDSGARADPLGAALDLVEPAP